MRMNPLFRIPANAATASATLCLNEVFTAKRLHLIAQGREALRATLGFVSVRSPTLKVSHHVETTLSGQKRIKATSYPGCARKASRPWAMLCNPVGVKNKPPPTQVLL